MRLKTVFIIMIYFFTGVALASKFTMNKHVAACDNNSTFKACKLGATGSINLMNTNGRFNAKNIFINIPNKVEGELRIYHSKFNQQDFVKGEFLLDNASNQNQFIHYHVLFKDKKGVVAQTKGSMRLEEGNRQKMRFSSIELSHKDIREITSYEIKLIASENETKRR